jgi:hypothetical protein
MKIYGSENALSDAPLEALLFRCMNGYESENDVFFFCLVRQCSRKWFTTSWKSYVSEPFHHYATLARSTGPSLAFQCGFNFGFGRFTKMSMAAIYRLKEGLSHPEGKFVADDALCQNVLPNPAIRFAACLESAVNLKTLREKWAERVFAGKRSENTICGLRMAHCVMPIPAAAFWDLQRCSYDEMMIVLII